TKTGRGLHGLKSVLSAESAALQCRWIFENRLLLEARVVKKGVKIEAPSGKLGVLIPGLGAVSTTFIAGVEAIKKKIAQPVGSLTQLGTIRLGKRTERRVPKIHDF